MNMYEDRLTAILERESPPGAGTTGTEVNYEVKGTACSGYLARPADDHSHPAVLVIHDFLGVTDYVRMRADMLARLGYVAFAADIYGAAVRPTAAEAPSVAVSLFGNPELWRTRILGGWERMLEVEYVDRRRTAAVGYCFGGASVLMLARYGVDVDAVVSFHGRLPTAPGVERITAKLLVLHGDADPLVDHTALEAFLEQLRGVPAVDWQLIVYAGALHAFTVPGSHGDVGAFHARSEARSWEAMKSFLAEVFES